MLPAELLLLLSFSLFLVFIFLSIKYGWFEMLCYFQMYSKLIQLYIHIYIYVFSDYFLQMIKQHWV